HFRAFCFVDGGFGPLAANVLHKTAVKNCRFLLLRGDQPEGMPEREHNTHLARALECEAREHHLDFTSIIMRGHGHELPPEYLALLGQWVRGEQLAEPGKNQPCPNNRIAFPTNQTTWAEEPNVKLFRTRSLILALLAAL